VTSCTSRSVSDNSDPNTLADPRIRPRPGARWVCPPCRRAIAAAGSGPEAEWGHPRDWRDALAANGANPNIRPTPEQEKARSATTPDPVPHTRQMSSDTARQLSSP
jgi:hypothetical protein